MEADCKRSCRLPELHSHHDPLLLQLLVRCEHAQMAISILILIGLQGLSNFLPTIVHDMGYSSVTAQGLTAPPYFAAFLCCVAVAFFSDRWGQRGFIVAFFSAMGGVGYLLLATIEDESKTGVRYLGVWLACCGVFPALAINITWLLNNQQGHSKRGAGLALLAIFGQCSSFVSSVLFPKKDS